MIYIVHAADEKLVFTRAAHTHASILCEKEELAYVHSIESQRDKFRPFGFQSHLYRCQTYGTELVRCVPMCTMLPLQLI